MVQYDRFGPYTVYECLGAGGMATVHRATIDIGGGVIHEVALKRLLTDDGHLKIIDFGVAKALSGRFMTSSGLIKGKLSYMSVEVLAGKAIDRRADIFSVGVVAWEIITGKRLFAGRDDFDVVKKIRAGNV